ncbi:unnamed protein product [Linum trigynum]|uniref:Terpene synthase metal-binding domain-containing protein n=1 Tax=Linum trigynum TaxID=586398 RepID=A0AAV2D0N2_9ROSI
MLSLYEAAYLRNQGESILDDAVQFTKSHLTSAASMAESPDSSELPLPEAVVVERIAHALERPLRKGVAILEHLFFISVYEKMAGHDGTLLRLAKLSFNVLQNMYQKELKVLTKWWIDLDLIRRNDYARDKLVEVYFWAVGCLWEPKFELARYTFTTIITIGSVFDDTYDAYGSLDELELFTAAIERWDPSMNSLNGKMKVLFEAMITGFDEIDIITSQEGRPYCLEYAKLSLKNMTKLYMEEARWLAKAYVPTLEEYRLISSLSTTYQSIVCATLCGLGTEVAPKEVFDWLFAEPNILVVSSDHCRLMDDIMSHKFEQERGHVASSVECYMLQYGVSNEEAVDALNEMVEEGELLDPPCRHIPKEVLSLFLGFEQVMDVLYKYSDGYTHSDTTTKDMLTALLVVPLPIAP